MILAIYNYGSTVYGTNGINSDQDYIVIVKSEDDKETVNKFFQDNADLNIYTLEEWNEKKLNMDVDYLECMFIRPCSYEGELDLTVELDYDKVNESIAHTASNSWVKCKKKLTVEKDCERIGRKSMWHSLRILMFGIQIMLLGKITDYSCANFLYEDIVNGEHNWAYLKEKYQPVYNNLHSQFKLAYEFVKITKK